MPDPKMMLNGMDEEAFSRWKKDHLEVSESPEEELASLWNATKAIARGVGKAVSTVKNVIDRDNDSDFDEKKHPRGPDGRFVSAPAGSRKNEKILPQRVKEAEETLYKAKLAQWESDKAKWEQQEIKKANIKIKKINDTEMKRAKTDLAKAKAFLKRKNLTDEQFETGSQNFNKAYKKVKETKNKINKIQPGSYPVKKPEK